MYVCSLALPLIYDTYINEKKHHEMLINYFIPDDLGGFQKEKKTFFIDNCDIVNPLKQPFKNTLESVDLLSFLMICKKNFFCSVFRRFFVWIMNECVCVYVCVYFKEKK